MNQSAASNWQAASGRRTALLEAIRRQGETVVQPLAEQFGVSAETLRRDLRHLESRGAIQRAYGMVRPVESGAFETPLDSRVQTNVAEKERIALAAVGQLGDAQTLYIDEGFNPQLVAQHLPTDRALMVATPSLPTAVLLAQWPNVEVIILGGRVRHNTLGVVDETARHMLSRLTIDLAIIGANGVSLDRGMTTPDPAVAVIKRAALDASIRRIFIGEHSKFGRASFMRFADVAEFEVLITGQELPSSRVRAFSAAGSVLLRV